MNVAVRVMQKEETVNILCQPGENLLDVLKRGNVSIAAPCGGKHTCGKCKVRISGGKLSEIAPEERAFLTEREIGAGVRLACFAKVLSDVQVLVESKDGALIQTDGILRVVEIDPYLKRIAVSLPPATLEDPRDNVSRLCGALGRPYEISTSLIATLASAIDGGTQTLTAVFDDTEIIKLLPGDRAKKQYAVAIDIGTTTVAAYLLYLQSGEVLHAKSELSALAPYGADVISRIQYTMDRPAGLAKLFQVERNQIDCMVASLLDETGIDRRDIDFCVLAGNTTMLHLVLNISPKGIATAPFAPAFTRINQVSSGTLGLGSFDGQVVTLPCVSSYVGGDITAGMAACGIDADEKLCLFVDLGTNGEMAIGCNSFIVACSTAAGPAFEGAEIQFGMGSVEGAIRSFGLQGDTAEYTTIGDKPPVGICGSGLLDLVAALLEYEIIDETGRMMEQDEVPETLYKYMVTYDGEPAFLVAKRQEGEPIVLTQKDVRQIQLAKAAIAAGIYTLLDEIGKDIAALEAVYLAGGFGSYLNQQSAVKIGLLPKALETKIKVIGNAAGMGAILAAQSAKMLQKMQMIAQDTRYLELSGHAKFQEYYIREMCFSDLEG